MQRGGKIQEINSINNRILFDYVNCDSTFKVFCSFVCYEFSHVIEYRSARKLLIQVLKIRIIVKEIV